MLMELMERREMRTGRSRAMMSELRHMLKEAIAANDDKAKSPKSQEMQREMLMRIEKMIVMLGEREF